MKRGESSHLNIGYIANIHYGLLPATLGAFRKLCPRVALNLFDMTCAEQFTALENHKTGLPHEGVVFRPLTPPAPPRIDHRVARGQSLEAAQGLHPDCEGSFAEHVNG